jgi:hypothetical protein
MDSLPWRKVWRQGIVPQLTKAGLRGLQKALERDSHRLITGATTCPPPLQFLAKLPVKACCPLCFALLDGKQPYAISVGSLEEQFALACYQGDQLAEEPGAIRYFLNWVDEAPRETMRRELLAEVKLALSKL